MFFHRWLLAGALALPACIPIFAMAAEAVTLTPEQAQTLGVRFNPYRALPSSK